MEIIQSLWTLVVAGGPGALSGVLFAGIVYLLWERQKLIDIITNYQKIVKQDRDQHAEAIVKIVDRYHQGNVELIQALNEIRLVLATMQKTMS